MNVRPMRESDLDDVSEIENASFSDSWNRSSFFNELRNPYFHGYIIESGISNSPAGHESPRIDGYICMHLIAGELHLLKIAVRPEKRREKIAEQLLARCLEIASEKNIESSFLEVRPSNHAAIRLYEKFGFEAIGIRQNYYTQYSGLSEDAIIMRTHLKRR